MTKRVALVTGANRGIGEEICRQLARKGIEVVMSARDAKKGEAAAKALASSGTPVRFVALDVNDEQSIAQAIAWIDATCGRLDILVNNAGVHLDARGAPATELAAETLRDTMETNVVGPLRVAQAALPLMRKHGYGRIVNLSSTMGQLDHMGGGSAAYRISKAALNALTRVLAADVNDPGIKVNSMHPGWVKTGMGGPEAPKSVEEGADTAVWLATLPKSGPSGGFFADRKAIPW